MENETQLESMQSQAMIAQMESGIENLLTKNMDSATLGSNLPVLAQEFAWLHKVLQLRLDPYLERKPVFPEVAAIPCPKLADLSAPYARFMTKWEISEMGRLVILLALAPHFCPEILDCLFIKNGVTGEAFTQFGGAKGGTHRGFLPTVATAAFVIAGNSLKERFDVFQLFEEDNFLVKHNIITLEKEHSKDPNSASIIKIGAEYLSFFTTGKPYHPKFGPEFPAKRLMTKMEWEDLVLELESNNKIEDLLTWHEGEKMFLEEWELEDVLKRGYRGLFYGPPGTGKTLTAALLGKKMEKEVYLVDGSKVVSKYIGETEKNLARVFDIAENMDWILFFDEADALFGKRTLTSDSKDCYANQEVSFLLQRIEDYAGTILLSTNLKANIDPAFMRRFQILVHFPVPSAPQRFKLWKRSFRKAPVDEAVDFKKIAKEYSISGGMILNVVRFCCVAAYRRDPRMIYEDDIVEGIKEEFRKEGKTI